MRTCKGHRRSPTRRRSRQRVPIDRTPTPWSAANVRCADRDKANRTSRHLQSQRFMNSDWRGFLLSSWFHPLICFPLLICSEWSTCGPQTPLKATKQDINYESSDWPLSYGCSVPNGCGLPTAADVCVLFLWQSETDWRPCEPSTEGPAACDGCCLIVELCYALSIELARSIVAPRILAW